MLSIQSNFHHYDGKTGERFIGNKTNGAATFSSLEEWQEKLLSTSDTLVRLEKLFPWQRFGDLLIKVRKDNSVKGGRPPYDEVMIFKCLILQSLYNLSDEDLEYMILDRLSFMEFLGLSIASDVPDHNTMGRFRELLKQHNMIRPLFELFDAYVSRHGFSIRKGLMRTRRLWTRRNNGIRRRKTPKLRRARLRRVLKRRVFRK